MGRSAAARSAHCDPDEMKRQDATHAALMAAVARRKSYLDSTDAEQMVNSIENRVQRNSKIQTVFRAAAVGAAERRRASMPVAGVAAPAGKPVLPRIAENGECFSVVVTQLIWHLLT